MTDLFLERTETVRVGAIEIGAGSVRFVALDVAADNSFEIVKSGGSSVDLQSAANDMQAAHLAVQSAIAYGRLCAHLSCQRIVTFITVPGRRWSDSVRDCFKRNIRSLIVLTAKQEAGFALFGSTLRLRNKGSDNSFCVLDVGKGSIELARGRCDAKFVKLLEWQTWLAGTHVARDILQNSHHDITKTSDQLRTLIHSQKFKVKSDEPVVALGNCVTNLARTTYFPQMRTPGMAAIHGLELTRCDISELLELRQANPEKFNALVEGEGTFADRDTALAGLLALQLICEITSIKRFTVSTYGTRFGLAVWCAQEIHSV
jgi:exopolyphosphatase/pppGpp-phosphohydrolase